MRGTLCIASGHNSFTMLSIVFPLVSGTYFLTKSQVNPQHIPIPIKVKDCPKVVVVTERKNWDTKKLDTQFIVVARLFPNARKCKG